MCAQFFFYFTYMYAGRGSTRLFVGKREGKEENRRRKTIKLDLARSFQVDHAHFKASLRQRKRAREKKNQSIDNKNNVATSTVKYTSMRRKKLFPIFEAQVK